MNEIKRTSGSSPFDSIRSVDETGKEYWSARELMPVLGYEKWERFGEVIERSSIACANSGNDRLDHFPSAGKMVSVGSGATRQVQDWHLSRYGAYLVAMNGDPRKPEIAAAQTYFAIRTREAEASVQSQLDISSLDAPKLLRALADTLESNRQLSVRLSQMEQKASFYDGLIQATHTHGLNAAAKAIGWGEYKFRQWLRIHCYLMENGLPYQEWINRGLFVVAIQDEYVGMYKLTGLAVPQVTGKGLIYFRDAIRKEVALAAREVPTPSALPGRSLVVPRAYEETMGALFAQWWLCFEGTRRRVGTLVGLFRAYPAFLDLLGPESSRTSYSVRVGKFLRTQVGEEYNGYRLIHAGRGANANQYRIEKIW